MLRFGKDDSIKGLEPVIAAGNVEGATDDVKVLQDGFKWTEEYFIHKGNTDDAVGFARPVIMPTSP